MLALLAFALAAPVPKDVPAHRSADFPADWGLKEIEGVMDRFAPAGKVHVLAWVEIDTKRPLVIQEILLVKALDKPDDGARFVLAKLSRVPEGRGQWQMNYLTLTEEQPNGVPIIVHHKSLKAFPSPPDDGEIAALLDKHKWGYWLKPEGKRVPELTAGGVVSANWKAVMNRQPKAELFPELKAK